MARPKKSENTLAVSKSEAEQAAERLGLGVINLHGLSDYKLLGQHLSRVGAVQVARGRYMASLQKLERIEKIIMDAFEDTPAGTEQFVPMAKLALEVSSGIVSVVARIEGSIKYVPDEKKAEVLTPCFPAPNMTYEHTVTVRPADPKPTPAEPNIEIKV